MFLHLHLIMHSVQGRAGRKNQPSFVTTFCGSGFKGIHDQYFYRFPEKIVSGKIGAPPFSFR